MAKSLFSGGDENPEVRVASAVGKYADPVESTPVQSRALQTPKGEDPKPFKLRG